MFVEPSLLELRKSFQKHGHDIMFVGGFVRDTLLGKTPKDVDLCTNATPEEQEAVYKDAGLQHIPTGLQHGTWTVVIDGETYEITTLRTETNHDGRHADVAWTRDWAEDLSRRDLTINAIAMGFDGTILDPFNGQKDLENRRVRFVGKAEERIKEDYLRILRFFRFHARIAPKTGDHGYDGEALLAAQANAAGLNGISRERVWSEISKIVSGPVGYNIIRDLISFDIAPHIGLPVNLQGLYSLLIAHANTKDPASLMASYLAKENDIEDLAASWKWSKEEKKQALYIVNQPTLSLKEAKRKVAVDGDKKYRVAETLRVQNDSESADSLMRWSIPKFPVNGDDMLSLGLVGAAIKDRLYELKQLWAVSNYKMTKEDLLK